MNQILIIDDDRTIVRIIELALRSYGYQVFSANDGEDGLAKAHSIHPDLIILDIMMPKMNGYQVCQALKASPETADIGVIMLTAKGDIDNRIPGDGTYVNNLRERLYGFDVGADDFLTKPIKLKELKQRIELLI
jgi:DNA-binding response OmpR family regulator